MYYEEKERDRLHDFVFNLFDAADMITCLENDGGGDLAEVFDEIEKQVGNINSAKGRYLDADREYTQELEYPDGYCD